MICGANLNFDTLLTSIEGLEADLLSGIDLDALALKAQLETSLSGLVTDLKALIPELPTIPSISLQTEIQDLIAMAPNSPEYLNKLTSITANFESGLIDAGQDLLGLVSSASTALAGGLDPCGAIPNFEIDSFGELAEKPLGSLQAQIPVVEEKLSEIADQSIEALEALDMSELDTQHNSIMAFASSPASVLASYEDSSGDG